MGDIENPIMVMARDDDAPVEPRCWQREWLGDELRHGTPPKTVSTDELDGITVAIYFAEPNHGASKGKWKYPRVSAGAPLTNPSFLPLFLCLD